MFRPGGRDENYNNDLEYLASSTFILRQNSDAFLDNDWTPLIPTTIDKVFVNRWKAADKTIYTVLNMRSEGVDKSLFEVENPGGKHFVSLWNHKNIVPVTDNGKIYLCKDPDGNNQIQVREKKVRLIVLRDYRI